MKYCAAVVASVLSLSDPAHSFGGFYSSSFNGLITSSGSTRSMGGLRMSLADLEDKLLSAPKSSTPATTNVKSTVEKPKVTPPPKVEKPKVEKPKIQKPVAKTSPTPKVEPVKPVPKKVTAVTKAPTVSAEPANISLGVALGAAPLVVLPLLALGAGRGALSKTVARREQIQKEIEAVEKKKRAKFNPPADSVGIAKATVRRRFMPRTFSFSGQISKLS
jgi:hypothetical protein